MGQLFLPMLLPFQQFRFMSIYATKLCSSSDQEHLDNQIQCVSTNRHPYLTIERKNEWIQIKSKHRIDCCIEQVLFTTTYIFLYCKSFQSYLESWNTKGKLRKLLDLNVLAKQLHLIYTHILQVTQVFFIIKKVLHPKNKSSIMAESTALESNCLY